MRFDILTIFPRLLDSVLQEGIIRRALQQGKAELHVTDIRSFATDRHAMTDDRPFGGGEGMVMKPEPIVAALDAIEMVRPGGHVILLSPQGRRYNQTVADELAGKNHIVMICGRYEGIDERVHRHWAHDEISIGDYILTGGELAALLIVDSVIRLLPGVLGCEQSVACDTFSKGLLKYPQYTRPRDFRSHPVPEILLSGDHERIAQWRFVESVRQTMRKRPDLLAGVGFTEKERKILSKAGIVLG